jgi:hypothetical protein
MDAGDVDDAIFEGLTQHLQGIPTKLGKLVYQI